MPSVTTPVITPRSNVVATTRPIHSVGRTIAKSMISSKYHLCERNTYAPENRSRIRSEVPGCATQMRYAIVTPAIAISAPITRPSHAGPLFTSTCTYFESANVGSRKRVTASSMPGIWTRPPSTASTASAPIAIFMGSSRSAMKWPGPGKPTSVSSSSPVIGLRGTSAWWRWPCSSSRASSTGSPQNARKIIRNV